MDWGAAVRPAGGLRRASVRVGVFVVREGVVGRRGARERAKRGGWFIGSVKLEFAKKRLRPECVDYTVPSFAVMC